MPTLRTTYRGAGWLTIAVALVVLVGGWTLDVERLRSRHPLEADADAVRRARGGGVVPPPRGPRGQRSRSGV